MMQEEQQFAEGRGGAMVEEAKKLMQQDQEEDQNKEVENAGPKIKMNKIGRKGKKGAEPAKASDKPGHQHPTEKTWKQVEKSENSGFSEQDIEFMKKAI